MTKVTVTVGPWEEFLRLLTMCSARRIRTQITEVYIKAPLNSRHHVTVRDRWQEVDLQGSGDGRVEGMGVCREGQLWRGGVRVEVSLEGSGVQEVWGWGLQE